ncbi:YdeI/OmpD-associated family protein, partial [Anaerofustis stercorihominis]
WEAKKAPSITEEEIEFLSSLLKDHETAYINFMNMSKSVKKTYTRAYLDAKTDMGKEKRLSWIIERLNKNLKPM